MKFYILVILVIVLFLLYIHECINRKRFERELLYFCEKLSEKVSEQEEGLIMLSTNNVIVKRVIMEVNNLLELNYQRNREYCLMRKNMLEVLTNVSHDLRTPLTILKGYIEILQDRMNTENPENKIIVSRLKKKTDETIRMLTQFFNMARIESGDMILNYQRTNISKVTEKTMFEYYDLLQKYGFYVDIKIPEKPIWVEIDEEAYKRIIKNLIDNGIKHGGKGGYLGVFLEEEKDFFAVEIEDHGEGILEKDMSHIFERRYSITSKLSVKHESSGLGLYISKKLAQKMDGDIIATSTPNKKTIFKLLIKKREKS